MATIDRESRNRLADALESFLQDRITAFALDEQIEAVEEASDDPTVLHVASEIWCCYDDFTDHQAVLSKNQWDYAYRLLLLLRSNAQVTTGEVKRWSLSQAVALISLGFGAVWLAKGFPILAVTCSLGLVSMMISHWRESSEARPSPRELTLIPFTSVSQMLRVRRSVRALSKRKHLPAIARRRIREPWVEAIMIFPQLALWLLFAPLVLLFQALPATETRTRVVA